MASTPPLSGAVHPDTQAVLLLCAAFPQARKSQAKPLTLSEYNSLASWLSRQGKRPASLLQNRDEIVPLNEPGLPARERLCALLDRGFQMAAAVEGWQRLGLWVMSRGEEEYPERLRRHLRSAAPPLLYGAGDKGRLNRGGLAVVGSRDIDEEALAFTRRVGERCAMQDVPLVSGGARGVDRAAVATVLQAGGGAVAVLAERLDRAATAREAREPLREGRLTLIAPYEPESGFTIAKAMGRNKHIYALADRALVVRFTANRGGTWAGANEQLGRNQSTPPGVPLFVRVAHNPEKGLEELRNRGALPFPEEAFWKSNFADVLPIASPAPEAVDEPVNASPEAQAVPPVDPAAPSPLPATIAEADSCYHRCLPLLLQHFQQIIETKQLAEIAKQLQLVPKQFEEWLKRAVEEGRLTKKKQKRRIVYLAASVAVEPTLFDGDGDAA